MRKNHLLASWLEGLLLRVTDLAVLGGAATHHAAVDSACHTVALLHIQLGKREALVVDCRVLCDVAS